jgi:ferredoxin--NADP+ reductase
MLVLHPDELAVTDTADHAIEALADSAVQEVVLLGRRGPAQAAFTNPELRELGELQRAGVVVDAADLDLDEASARWLEQDAEPTNQRNVEILRGFAESGPREGTHRVVLKFLRSPVEILGEGNDGPVTAIRLAKNRIEDDGGRLRAVATGEEEVIECGLVLRSIGYRGHPVGELPFDEDRGLIRNNGGRVCEDDEHPCEGEYVVGWIKRGPSGVIGTNKKDAADTVARITEDLEAGRVHEPTIDDRDEIGAWLLGAADAVVTWDGWQAINAIETAAGENCAPVRPRVKLTEWAALREAARRTPSRMT